MDGQFEPLHNNISGLGVTLNTVAREEHVPEIEKASPLMLEESSMVVTLLIDDVIVIYHTKVFVAFHSMAGVPPLADFE